MLQEKQAITVLRELVEEQHFAVYDDNSKNLTAWSIACLLM